ncbi:Ldh family oxidoreductase [Candidatus Margulisiibacteriota bacterium]
MKHIDAQILKRFILEVLAKLNVNGEVAHHLCEAMIQTSLRGVDSHGIRLFPHYVQALEAGRINGNPEYNFEQTNSCTGRLDADHTYGHAAGARAMQEAMVMAQKSGIGAVAVYNSSHFGAAAYYALMAARQDMIGLSFTHADSLMQTFNGKRPYLGTNPICFAAPCNGEEPFCLDMATTQYNWNKVKQHRERDELLPPGIAVNEQGMETLDPHEARALQAIGLYKGFGLSMIVEILCSLLTGMPFGRKITSMFETPIEEHRYLGQFYMAINIESFSQIDSFKARISEMMAEIRREPVYDSQEIMVPGDPEKKQYKLRIKEGIPLSEKDVELYLKMKEKNKISIDI